MVFCSTPTFFAIVVIAQVWVLVWICIEAEFFLVWICIYKMEFLVWKCLILLIFVWTFENKMYLCSMIL